MNVVIVAVGSAAVGLAVGSVLGACVARWTARAEIDAAAVKETVEAGQALEVIRATTRPLPPVGRRARPVLAPVPWGREGGVIGAGGANGRWA